MIDLFNRDSLISDLVENEVYLVGNDRSKHIFVCKRVSCSLIFMEFTSSIAFTFAKRVDDKVYIEGIDRKSGKLFEEFLDFSEVGIQELLFKRILNFVEVDSSKGYIKEFLPQSSISIK